MPERNVHIRPGAALVAVAVGLAVGLGTIAGAVWLVRLAWSLDLTYRVLLGVLLLFVAAWTWYVANDARAMLFEIDKQNDR